MNKKKVHIVVQDGLVQAVYAECGLNIEVELLDLDYDDAEERVEIEASVEQLRDTAVQVY